MNPRRRTRFAFARRVALATGTAILLVISASVPADAAITRGEISAAVLSTNEAEAAVGPATGLVQTGRSCGTDDGIRACGRTWKQADGYGGMYPYVAAVSVFPTAAKAREFIRGGALPAGAEVVSSTATTRIYFLRSGSTYSVGAYRAQGKVLSTVGCAAFDMSLSTVVDCAKRLLASQTSMSPCVLRGMRKYLSPCRIVMQSNWQNSWNSFGSTTSRTNSAATNSGTLC